MSIFQAFARPAVAVVLAAFALAAHAQEPYPNRPVRIIVPLGPGSATDVLARLIAESLNRNMKGTFVVENKAGAGGEIGADYVAKAKPDGYILGFFHSSVLTASAAINPKLPYNPSKDFTPLGIAASNPIVLAVPVNSPFKTLDSFVDAARKDPGKYTSGFIGVGSHSQFNLELLNIVAGVKITAIPYAGGTGPLLTGLLGGQIDSASALWAALPARSPPASCACLPRLRR
jgi:tripartite-type tricarboxylate transporter receptor subunit TctC